MNKIVPAQARPAPTRSGAVLRGVAPRLPVSLAALRPVVACPRTCVSLLWSAQSCSGYRSFTARSLSYFFISFSFSRTNSRNCFAFENVLQFVKFF